MCATARLHYTIYAGDDRGSLCCNIISFRGLTKGQLSQTISSSSSSNISSSSSSSSSTREQVKSAPRGLRQMVRFLESAQRPEKSGSGSVTAAAAAWIESLSDSEIRKRSYAFHERKHGAS